MSVPSSHAPSCPDGEVWKRSLRPRAGRSRTASCTAGVEAGLEGRRAASPGWASAATTRPGRGDGGAQEQVGAEAGGLAAARGGGVRLKRPPACRRSLWRRRTATCLCSLAGDLLAWPHRCSFLDLHRRPLPHFYYRCKQGMRLKFGRLSIKCKVPQRQVGAGRGCALLPSPMSPPQEPTGPQKAGAGGQGELRRRRRENDGKSDGQDPTKVGGSQTQHSPIRGTER